MARLPRLAIARQLHLWLQRSSGGHPVFLDDEDHALYLACLRELAPAHGVAVHAYALLPTEVLMLLTPEQAQALGALAQAQGRRFGAAYNRRHGRSGVLWEGRFRTTVVDAAKHALDSLLHVEQAPWRAGLVARPGEYRWSSAGHHLGLRHDALIVEHPSHWQLGNTPFEREAAYRQAHEQGVPPAWTQRIADCLHKGWVLGDAHFVASLAAATDRPLLPRNKGRSKKSVPNSKSAQKSRGDESV